MVVVTDSAADGEVATGVMAEVEAPAVTIAAILVTWPGIAIAIGITEAPAEVAVVSLAVSSDTWRGTVRKVAAAAAAEEEEEEEEELEAAVEVVTSAVSMDTWRGTAIEEEEAAVVVLVAAITAVSSGTWRGIAPRLAAAEVVEGSAAAAAAVAMVEAAVTIVESQGILRGSAPMLLDE